MTRRSRCVALALATASVCAASANIRAHAGPPFPIVSDRVAGPYRISVWTDPDATDDGTAAGQFWVIVEPLGGGQSVPAGTHVTVTIGPLGRDGERRSGSAVPDNGDVSRQFVALLMDDEGRYGVEASVRGPLGEATVEAEVDATYDLRPPAALIALYLLPFLLVGGLWLKLLVRRRAHEPPPPR